MRQRGWGSPNSDEGTYTVVLCICKYFVVVVQARQDVNRFQSFLKGLQIRVLAGRYDNPIPIRFLAPIDCLKFKHCGLASKKLI